MLAHRLSGGVGAGAKSCTSPRDAPNPCPHLSLLGRRRKSRFDVDSDVIENATPGCSRSISKWLNCSLAFRFDWCLVTPQCLCTWHLATGFPNTTHQKSKKMKCAWEPLPYSGRRSPISGRRLFCCCKFWATGRNKTLSPKTSTNTKSKYQILGDSRAEFWATLNEHVCSQLVGLERDHQTSPECAEFLCHSARSSEPLSQRHRR